MKSVHVLSLLWMMACSSSTKDAEKLNSQSILLHNSMVRKSDEMEHHLNELLLLKEKTSVSEKDSVVILLGALEEWEKDLVEIPGNESHEHSDHHHHDHKVLEVTAEQMLLIQKEMDRRLAIIGRRIKAFTQIQK